MVPVGAFECVQGQVHVDTPPAGLFFRRNPTSFCEILDVLHRRSIPCRNTPTTHRSGLDAPRYPSFSSGCVMAPQLLLLLRVWCWLRRTEHCTATATAWLLHRCASLSCYDASGVVMFLFRFSGFWVPGRICLFSSSSNSSPFRCAVP